MVLGGRAVRLLGIEARPGIPPSPHLPSSFGGSLDTETVTELAAAAAMRRAAPRTNLPEDLTKFIGREEELATTADELERHRL